MALLEDFKVWTEKNYEVYIVPTLKITNILREIGRLREITFRQVGEGTNKKIDLDNYDIYYNHLFIWDKETQMIVGAYRIGKGDEILDTMGKRGFYISELFKIKEPFYPILRQGIELGRSWIRKEYQLKPLPLFLLWKGILKYLVDNPKYRYMFGPVSISNNLRELSSSNVIGYIEGSEKPDEAVIYMAHWDHFGLDFSRPDDKIFNGAQDNAGGVAALLALAEQFKAGPAPKRSVAFLAVTVEERGLLGSAWYANNPLFELNKTVAGINMDVINVYGPMRDVMVFGYGSSELEPVLSRYAKAQNRYIAPEPTPQDGFYYRSDHFNLAKKGVPMLYARGGIDSVEHGKDWGLKQRQRYVSDYYHKVTDEFDPAWDLRGAQQDLFLYFQVGNELANNQSWPNWLQGKEFKAVRDKSLSSKQ